MRKFLTLSTLMLGAMTGAQEEEEESTHDEYDFKTTLPILASELHTSCQVHSGYNLTMVYCSDSFEVYDTQTLEDQDSLLTNYGESRRIVGVHNSMKDLDSQSITFLEGHSQGGFAQSVHKLFRDADTGVVHISKLMELKLEAGDVATDLFVFDGIVAVRINDNEFRFFIEPLVFSDPIEPLERDDFRATEEIFADESATDSTQNYAIGFDYTTLLAYSFAPMAKADDESKLSLTLYGVRQQVLVKIVYTLDSEAMMMREKVTLIYTQDLIGEQMRMECTKDYVILSDADGKEPGIYYYDLELDQLEYFKLELQEEAPYNLELNIDETFDFLQVYVAGANTLSIIETTKNRDGNPQFNMIENVWVATDIQPFASDQTWLARSADQLVFKQSSKRTLGLMPICSYRYSYKPDNMSCHRCEPGLKSYGLQDEQCITCMRAWLLGSGDNFRNAQYQTFCNNGHIFSLILFSVVPVVAIVASIICCCFARGGGIVGQQDEMHKKQKVQTGIKRTPTLFVRTTSRRQRQNTQYETRKNVGFADEEKQQTGPAPGPPNMATGRLETDAPMYTEENDAQEQSRMRVQPDTDRQLAMPDDLSDDGESQNFSDTENDEQHYVAPGGMVMERVRTQPTKARDVNASAEAEANVTTQSRHNDRDIRQTVKTNARPADDQYYEDDYHDYGNEL